MYVQLKGNVWSKRRAEDKVDVHDLNLPVSMGSNAVGRDHPLACAIIPKIKKRWISVCFEANILRATTSTRTHVRDSCIKGLEHYSMLRINYCIK